MNLLAELIGFLKEYFPAEHKKLVSGNYDVLTPVIINEFCEYQAKKGKE